MGQKTAFTNDQELFISAAVSAQSTMITQICKLLAGTANKEERSWHNWFYAQDQSFKDGWLEEYYRRTKKQLLTKALEKMSDALLNEKDLNKLIALANYTEQLENKIQTQNQPIPILATIAFSGSPDSKNVSSNDSDE